MGLKKWFFALIMLCFIASCNEDSDIQPAYQFALTEVTTDHQGKAHTLLLDDGTELALNTPISGLKADSTYRLQTLFVQNEQKAQLHSYAQVLAPEAKAYKTMQLPMDAVNVVTYWQGKHYVNLRLAIKGTAEGTHLLGFNDEGIRNNVNGTQTRLITLLHNQNNDPLYYTREVYLSLPLRPFIQSTPTDSLCLQINTFQGVKSFVFSLK